MKDDPHDHDGLDMDERLYLYSVVHTAETKVLLLSLSYTLLIYFVSAIHSETILTRSRTYRRSRSGEDDERIN